MKDYSAEKRNDLSGHAWEHTEEIYMSINKDKKPNWNDHVLYESSYKEF